MLKFSFSNNTPETTVNLWQETFETIQADGTYDAIYEKWRRTRNI